MLTDTLIMLGMALVFACIEMSATWLIARKLRNNGIVDIVWSAGFAPVLVLYIVCFTWRNGRELSPTVPMLVMLLLVCMWSMRLAKHLFHRVRHHHPAEDVRYAKLRHDWGDATDRKMFWFFQLQGALQVVLSLPFLLVCLSGYERHLHYLSNFNLIGCLIFVIAIIGEITADDQLARFRADPANKGKVCQAGLWNWSRHPNYFFEWLVWVGYAVFALGSPWGWLGLLAPALMLHFLLNVTGIPMTEELSLKSKGDAYRAYQRTTSAFVPWFKKATTDEHG